MVCKTKCYTVRDIDEIKKNDPELYQKILENNVYINVDIPEWFEPEIEYCQEQLNKIGLTFKREHLTFDLDRNELDISQFDIIDIDKLKKYLKKKYTEGYKESIKEAKLLAKDETQLTYSIDYKDILNDEIISNLKRKPDYYQGDDLSIGEWIRKDLRSEIENKILNFLKNTYESLTEEDAIYETLKINEYLFNNAGEID